MITKNKLSFFLFAVFLVFTLIACKSPEKDSTQINIVCAMFPEYDWTRNIAAGIDDVNISYLISNGTDPHSYQPTVKDITLIASADIFIFGGGESEKWIEDTLTLKDCNPDMKIINMMELLEGKIYIEEEKEGMQEDRHSKDEEESEYDEHVWLSLRNAMLVCTEITSVLSDSLPEQAEALNSNQIIYEEKLAALDKEYSELMLSSLQNTILVADRFPFRYLAEDYGIDYYAAFSGCSADAEASFETLVFLTECIEQNNLNTVFVLEGSDEKLAKAAIKNSKHGDCQILVLESMQAIRAKQADSTSYINIMKKNLNALSTALN